MAVFGEDNPFLENTQLLSASQKAALDFRTLDAGETTDTTKSTGKQIDEGQETPFLVGNVNGAEVGASLATNPLQDVLKDANKEEKGAAGLEIIIKGLEGKPISEQTPGPQIEINATGVQEAVIDFFKNMQAGGYSINVLDNTNSDAMREASEYAGQLNIPKEEFLKLAAKLK